MILLTTITDRLEKVHENIRFEFDVRYMDKWIKMYPNAFPQYVKNNNHNIVFNPKKLRYEIYKNKPSNI